MIRSVAAALALLLLSLVTGIASTSWAISVTLECDTNSQAPEGYHLFKRISGGDYDYSAPDADGVLVDGVIRFQSYCDPGATCLWVARAFDGDNESGDSNEVSYTSEAEPAPGTPLNISTVEENGVMYLITAPMPAAQAKGFQVEIGGETYQVVAEQVDAENVRLHFDLKALDLANGTHEAMVSAKNGWGVGTAVPFGFVKASPGVPSGIGLSED